jgi:hypothetical protein
MQHSMAQSSAGVAYHTGSEHGVVSHYDTVSERNVFCQPGTRAQLHVSADDYLWPDEHAGAEAGSRPDPRGGIDPGILRIGREHCSDDSNQGLVGIPDNDACGGTAGTLGQLFRDQDGAGSRGAEIGGVSGGNCEGKGLGTGSAERPDRVDANIPVTKQAATDEIGNRLRGKTTSRHATSCPL